MFDYEKDRWQNNENEKFVVFSEQFFKCTYM